MLSLHIITEYSSQKERSACFTWMKSIAENPYIYGAYNHVKNTDKAFLLKTHNFPCCYSKEPQLLLLNLHLQFVCRLDSGNFILSFNCSNWEITPVRWDSLHIVDRILGLWDYFSLQLSPVSFFRPFINARSSCITWSTSYKCPKSICLFPDLHLPKELIDKYYLRWHWVEAQIYWHSMLFIMFLLWTKYIA